MQNFCDLSEVVNKPSLSGGVGLPLLREASTPGYLLTDLRAVGTASFACKKVRCVTSAARAAFKIATNARRIRVSKFK